jgi:hypothetical protein
MDKETHRKSAVHVPGTFPNLLDISMEISVLESRKKTWWPGDINLM